MVKNPFKESPYFLGAVAFFHNLFNLFSHVPALRYGPAICFTYLYADASLRSVFMYNMAESTDQDRVFFFWNTARLANIAQSESTRMAWEKSPCHAIGCSCYGAKSGPSVPWCSHLVEVETTFG